MTRILNEPESLQLQDELRRVDAYDTDDLGIWADDEPSGAVLWVAGSLLLALPLIALGLKIAHVF